MIIDLCSGKGSWPGETVRIDHDRKVRPTILADIRYLPLRRGLKPELVHASPPCQYVSKARRWRWGWNPKGIAQSLRLIASCYDAFDYLEGENCILEQPAGLQDILGHRVSFKYDKADIRNATTNFYSNNKALKRAKIPLAVRKELLKSLRTSRT